MKSFFEALRALLTFKPDTRLPRIVEIVYGLMAWALVVIFIMGITKIVAK